MKGIKSMAENVSVTNFRKAEISANTLWHRHTRH